MNSRSWIQAVAQCEQKREPFVIATVIEHKGSTPRDTGAKMVITACETFDTIGGGNLEFQVTRSARELLLAGGSKVVTEEYPLSAKLAQCCGGHAKVLLETQLIEVKNIAVFGAGHVANELLPILQRLPVKLHWIDEREGLFADNLQTNVIPTLTDCPVSELKALPADTLIVVMTHNHQLDFDLVKAAVSRDDIDYVGMIGSKTKAKRFLYKLKQRGLSDENINKLVSPIGELAVPGKNPIEVAISIAAQIVQLLHKPSDICQDAHLHDEVTQQA